MVSFFYDQEIFISLIELIFGLIIFITMFKKTTGFRYINFGRGVITASGLMIIIKELVSLSGLIDNSINELMTAITYLLFAVGISMFYKKDVFRKYLDQLRPRRKEPVEAKP